MNNPDNRISHQKEKKRTRTNLDYLMLFIHLSELMHTHKLIVIKLRAD